MLVKKITVTEYLLNQVICFTFSINKIRFRLLA